MQNESRRVVQQVVTRHAYYLTHSSVCCISMKGFLLLIKQYEVVCD